MENADNSMRCPWCGTDPLYVAYHDQEWGRPERDPRRLFELLMLEAFQAGLSWITVLRKRPAFRAAFHGFDPETLAIWGEAEVTRLCQDPGIIRHRGKIDSTLRAARAFQRIEADRGFSPFLWSFTGGQVLRGDGRTMAASAELAGRVSKDLKRRGFSFVGPTIVQAWLQAVGIVNDHAEGCFRRDA